eukprot:CAMPEP_0177745440 /NCGR_PEP_ID=MMETSP0484_2-20121128/30313_1 /TAXON_ID=354590 /ORGANISM="Rhodomonas lens, Strain RHODO" /LENGTH=425 /DNA_ID=CAMNT_0019260075 /DNA_START=234 /DNA_END=1513 /DNA_ORIENTATION=-
MTALAPPDAAAKETQILYIGFNQDQSCFAVGTNSGFKVFNCSPFKEQVNRELDGGGIRYVEMLFQCNLFALIGAPNNGRFPPNKVIIWDDVKRKDVGDISLRQEAKGVRLRRDKVVVVLEYKVLVYNFKDLECVMEIDTVSNPKGLCALCPSPSNPVLVFAAPTEAWCGCQAHTSPLNSLALTLDGSRLVTASEKGTILRVMDSLTGRMLQELRRGAHVAEMCCLAFNHTSSLLACSSVRGTVHVFQLVESCAQDSAAAVSTSDAAKAQHQASPANQGSNSRSSLSFFGGLVNYFNSEWSFARFRLPGAETNVHSICSFAAERNTLMVVTATGQLHTCLFNPEGAPGQECEAATSISFLPQPKPALDDGSDKLPDIEDVGAENEVSTEPYAGNARQGLEMGGWVRALACSDKIALRENAERALPA